MKQLVAEQVALFEQLEHFVEQRLDLEQGQGVELVEQVVDDLDAVGGGDDGEGFVLLGQRSCR